MFCLNLLKYFNLSTFKIYIGQFDRHYGYDIYIGSGAWLTNHMSGEYVYDETGEICHWTYFVKISIAPKDVESVESVGSIWYAVDGTEIGPVIWGSFAIIQEVENDSHAGINGLQHLSSLNAGLGYY
jgi:hypothetical protein